MTAKLSGEYFKQTIASVLLMNVRHVCSCLLFYLPIVRRAHERAHEHAYALLPFMHRAHYLFH